MIMATMTETLEYQRIMDRLLSLPSCALVTTGRTGSDFLQSLLDSHPQILMMSGAFFYHRFWEGSVCVAAGLFEVADFVDEFIGHHIHKLKSRYDLQERKDQLGEQGDRSIDIDLARFRELVLTFLEGRRVDSRNSLVAVCAAYAICLGEDVEQKTLFVHHAHHFDELVRFLKDFPDSRIICTTRDPRANFVSGIEHWRRYSSQMDQGNHLYFYIRRILADATPILALPNSLRVIRIEDMGKDGVLRSLSCWLGIEYRESMMRSTWGGLSWHGDRLSSRGSGGKGWSGELLKNRWNERLGVVDKYVLNYIMNGRLRHYGYAVRKTSPLDVFLVPLAIVLPLRFERRFFSLGYLANCFRRRDAARVIRNALCYFKRVSLFFRYYVRATVGNPFSTPLLADETAEA